MWVCLHLLPRAVLQRQRGRFVMVNELADPANTPAPGDCTQLPLKIVAVIAGSTPDSMTDSECSTMFRAVKQGLMPHDMWDDNTINFPTHGIHCPLVHAAAQRGALAGLRTTTPTVGAGTDPFSDTESDSGVAEADFLEFGLDEAIGIVPFAATSAQLNAAYQAAAATPPPSPSMARPWPLLLQQLDDLQTWAVLGLSQLRSMVGQESPTVLMRKLSLDGSFRLHVPRYVGSLIATRWSPAGQIWIWGGAHGYRAEREKGK